MSTFMIITTCSLCVCFGFMAGQWVRNTAFASQGWKFLRWDDKILGYRAVPESYIPKLNDRMLMAVEVDTSDPEEVKVK